MPYSRDEQDDIDHRMFGCSRAVLKNNFEDLIRYQSPLMGVLSILSDIQELSSMGDKHSTQLKINQVKYLIDEYLISKELSIQFESER